MLYYDVIIIGGGPSGAYLAYNLLQKGINCCIIDKTTFPREKLCGGLITKKTMVLLENQYDKVDSFFVNQTDTVSLFFKETEILSVKVEDDLRFVDRFTFDYALLKKYQNKGGVVYENEHITNFDTKNNIINTKSNKFSYRYLIGADGANSIVRKLVDTNYKPNGLCLELSASNFLESKARIYFGIVNNGYGWVFPKSDYSVIGCGGVYCKGSKLIDQFNAFIHQFNLSNSLKKKGAFVPFGKYIKTPGTKNIFLIGDAAGLVDPITGEGLYFSFLSAHYLSNALESFWHDDKNILKNYLKNLSDNIHIHIKSGNIAKKIVFNRYIQKTIFKLLPNHPHLVEYLLNNVILQYNVTYMKSLQAYKKMKRNKVD